jgi:hypothetical protein
VDSQGNAAHMLIGRWVQPGSKYRYNPATGLRRASTQITIDINPLQLPYRSLHRQPNPAASIMSDYVPRAQQHQTVGEALARRASNYRIFALPDSGTTTRLLRKDVVPPHGGDAFWVRNCSSRDLDGEDWVGGLTADQVDDEAAAIAQIRGL